MTFGEGRNGGLWVGDLPSMHKIYGQRWARHLQRGRKNVQGNSQESSVYTGDDYCECRHVQECRDTIRSRKGGWQLVQEQLCYVCWGEGC